MSSSCRSKAARCRISSTAFAAGSSSKKAIKAQLSSTFVVAISQVALSLAVLHHGFEDALALQRTAQTADVGARNWLEQNAFGRGHDCCFCSFFNLKFLAELTRDYHLALDGEGYGFCGQCIHPTKLYFPIMVSQLENVRSNIIC